MKLLFLIMIVVFGSAIATAENAELGQCETDLECEVMYGR